MQRENLTGWDSFLYYLAVLFTLGGAFITKIIVKKALYEMLEARGA